MLHRLFWFSSIKSLTLLSPYCRKTVPFLFHLTTIHSSNISLDFFAGVQAGASLLHDSLSGQAVQVLVHTLGPDSSNTLTSSIAVVLGFSWTKDGWLKRIMTTGQSSIKIHLISFWNLSDCSKRCKTILSRNNCFKMTSCE